MKKVALFATILALALSATAQESHYPGPTAVGPNASNGASANANGVTTTQAANARSVSADARRGPLWSGPTPSRLVRLPTSSGGYVCPS